MRRLILFLAALLLVPVLAGCAADADPSGLSRSPEYRFDGEGRYLCFEGLPRDYTPEQALADGCLVITGSEDVKTRSALYGGAERWQEFLEASSKGRDAALRAAYFIDGTPSYIDLYYREGAYRYIRSEALSSVGSFRYLRALRGLDGPRRKEFTKVVLTDSFELTYRDINRMFFSSSLDEIARIPPFYWLGFTSYLDLSARDTAAWYTGAQLFDMVGGIMQPTKAFPDLQLSSDAWDYINAHRELYDELAAGGRRVADVFIARLRESETFGLDKYIMAAVCAEITGVGRDGGWASAPDWLALYDREE